MTLLYTIPGITLLHYDVCISSCTLINKDSNEKIDGHFELYSSSSYELKYVLRFLVNRNTWWGAESTVFHCESEHLILPN